MGKEYIKPGDLVQINKELAERPVMVVGSIEKVEKSTGKSVTQGIRCFWFDRNHAYQEQVFNFKDLEVC